ncbi:hypothetical protein BRARA_A01372 [Brassica rapa]|uniref:BnaA01g13290D protein n=3 Tax=Brassica TaxID=3705 RepID=A0A078I2T8_BRANA|nr:uncharacterized protein LOC106358995 [Brassica napus]RID78559.1 hypothetical protein BRARA_A01372 [Brassica rapa]KAH0941698.1 hypothetical protein HID58_001335 [Brassica napus]CAF2149421.1 unnamed protein product [Brassica napus]CAG7887428.1 unnamed protein product [Brassica rapa]CDY44121.1 BnaA01g13290D [Brassica napus]
MAESNGEDPAKSLAPLYLTPRSDQPEEDQYQDQTKQHVHHDHQRTKLILCCGFILSLTILIAVTFIILSLTVFHLHSPKLTVTSISIIQPLDFVNGKVNTTQNATLAVEISLHNPNPAVFKVKDVSVLFYHDELVVVVGESTRRSETIPAKKTVEMNLTTEIDTRKLLASVPGLMEDFNGSVVLRNRVAVNGKVKMIKIFKKSVQLKTDCVVTMMMMNNSSKPSFDCNRTRNTYEHVRN